MQVLIVRKGDKIAEFQRKFHEMFPYLKIEFTPAKSNHIVSSGMEENMLFTEPTQTSTSELVLSRDMNFADVASAFGSIFGLQAKLYRKAASSWIETIHTRDWSLQDQNNLGQRISGVLGDIHEDHP